MAAKVGEMIVSVETAVEKLDIRRWDNFPASEDVSFKDWVRNNGLSSPFVDALARHLTSAVVGREPEETGLHYLLDYIKSAGGYHSIISEGEEGAQSLKIKQGKQSTILLGDRAPRIAHKHVLKLFCRNLCDCNRPCRCYDTWLGSYQHSCR